MAIGAGAARSARSIPRTASGCGNGSPSPAPAIPPTRTWEGNSWKRGGAAVWSGVAIDPGSNTLYIDTGNPQPDFLGDKRKGKNLYTDSMIALDIAGAKPKMKWY